MGTIVQWNAGISSACVCGAARKMIRLPCLCVHRNMNVITPPYPILYIQISGVYMWPWDRLCVHVTAVLRAQMTAPVCTCDRGMACVYMWPPFCVRRWPYGTKKVSACTCDLDLRARMTPWPLQCVKTYPPENLHRPCQISAGRWGFHQNCLFSGSMFM